MIEGIPRISVRIITYKQEVIIKRAIDSLLAQKDYIYEICVSDDCSPDGTWEVLQEYDKKYPGLFKLHRNEHNLGIFENIEKSWTMPTGDIVYSLAGDDECAKGWFRMVVDYINLNKIDYKNELFCIYGNYKAVYPKGDELIFRNNLILSSYNPVTLSLMGMVGNRGCCFSIKIWKKFRKVSLGKSHIAETALDIQLPLFLEKFYYIDCVGNIYHTAIGVSSHIDNKVAEERIQIMPYAFNFLKNNGYAFTDKDNKAYEYNIAYKQFFLRKTISSFVVLLYRFATCYGTSPRLLYKYFKRMFVSIIRRFPHNTPLKLVS